VYLGASGYQFAVAIVLHQLQSLLHTFFLRHDRVISDGLFVLPPLLCNRHRYPGISGIFMVKEPHREGLNRT
jgi:hypothetical protein